ncbi:hypothetical protein KP509_02G059100 [Ceratopteris richardii]|uniref:Uncharacterized protein n=1 Tax=Ceratopteris richardii TaxID=49495 RepID=A0A8T2VDC8_CERRI|nr:hypothetical protein KP509_02G059100 [Ceratopteris richardii]
MNPSGVCTTPSSPEAMQYMFLIFMPRGFSVAQEHGVGREQIASGLKPDLRHAYYKPWATFRVFVGAGDSFSPAKAREKAQRTFDFVLMKSFHGVRLHGRRCDDVYVE